MLYFITKIINIFRYLKLEIALPIPASNNELNIIETIQLDTGKV